MNIRTRTMGVGVFSVGLGILLTGFRHGKNLGSLQGLFAALFGPPPLPDGTSYDWVDNFLVRKFTLGRFVLGESSKDTQGIVPKKGRDQWWLQGLVGFARAFLGGYLLRTLVALLNHPGALHHPGKFLGRIMSKQHCYFPLFLATLVGTVRGLSGLLRSIVGRELPLNTFLVGIAAGQALRWSYSADVAMHCGGKATEFLFWELVQRFLFVPITTRGILRPIRGGEAVLFALSAATVFYHMVFDISLVRPTCWKALQRVTGGRSGLLGHFPAYGKLLKGDLEMSK